MTQLYALGLGIGTKNQNGDWLEVYYQSPLLAPSEKLSASLAEATGYANGNQAIELSSDQLHTVAAALDAAGETAQSVLANALSESERPVVLTMLAEDAELSSTPEAYLKLHLLSHRLVKPHETSLAGIFPLLPNVAWTNQGAIDLTELPQRQLQARMKGELLEVTSIDKFPKMTDYVVPAGVRIADTSRVRLGAYIGEGTTIMHEGFVNFNAGTAGTSMIEGRISAGVFVGKGSDLGGSSSTMGTLSGGGNIIISVGQECLLGANAGIGIPLGDRCTVEAGLYVTAATKVSMLDDSGNAVETVKARDLASKSDLLFRRNSVNGVVECLTNKSAVELNEELHSNN